MYGTLYSASADLARQALAGSLPIRDVLRSIDAAETVGLEKSWQGLHFVLTGTVDEGEPPLNFIHGSGEWVETSNVDCPIWVITADRVALLDAALAEFTDAEFARRFDPARMAEAGVYPGIWDEPRDDLLAEYLWYLGETRQLVARAAHAGNAILIEVG